MEVVYERCCGLDVHKKTVVACLLTPGVGGRPKREVRTFGTYTRDLLALADWLGEAGCTEVAMESTGSYWKPIYNLLESRFHLIIVNARHLKIVPGRKSDVKDAEWIADLLRHGLLRQSFIPSRPQRELRELTRYRTKLVRTRSSEINRVQKVLEGANIKLASVASDVMGVSGRAMLEAMVSDATPEPAALADLARGRLRAKRGELEAALSGLIGDHQRFLLAEQLSHIDDLDRRIVRLDQELERRLGAENEDRDNLDSIPGVGKDGAEVILAEVGTNLESFADAGHLTSWALMAPGINESAGKNRSGRTPPGNRALRGVLIQAAFACRRTKTFLGVLFRRLAARIGPVRAAIAVGRRILVIAYHVLKEHVPYKELGADYHDLRSRAQLSRRYTRGLERLGYTVQLELAPAT
jgi:transposase